MHHVVLESSDRNGTKRADAHVQRQACLVDPLRSKPGEQLRGEVQTCGGCCDGTGPFGENSLIVLHVALAHLAAANVRGQWHATNALQNFPGRSSWLWARHPNPLA